jgi:hypothetical protein
VFGKILAVLEVEFLLPTLFRGGAGNIATSRGIAQNGGAELLVDEDASVLLRHPSRDGRLEAVVDHLLGSSDLCGLLWTQGALPAEHPRLERAPMVKR